MGRYQPWAAISSATASGTRWRIGRPSATRRRRSVDETSSRGMSKNTIRVPSCSGRSRAPRSPARTSSRSATARRARRRISRGSCHVGRLSAMSPPTMNVSSSPGSRSCSTRSVSAVYDGPARSSSTAQTPSTGSPATASRQRSRRASAPGSPAISLCGGVPAGMRTTRSRASWSRASWAQTRCPTCGGLKVPPRIPTRATRSRQDRTWPSPVTTYLVVHSSRRPIGPRACSFCVELPISAPMPNSPPSVKRVDAFT